MKTQSLPDSTSTIPNSVYELTRHINQREHSQQVMAALAMMLQHSIQQEAGAAHE